MKFSFKHIFTYFPCIFLMLYFSGCVSYRQNEGKRKLVKAYTRSPLFTSHFSGMVIKDMKNGEILLNVNGKKLFTPASNTKLITFYVADQILPDSIPSIKYCRWNDTLYFSGMGDPTLLYPGFKTQKTLDLLRDTTAQLAYSLPAFSGRRYGPGWAWDDFPYYFQPEKSALPVYGNSVWIKKNHRDSLVVFPDFFNVSIEVDTSLLKLKAGRRELDNIFDISYRRLPEKLEKSVPFMTSDSIALALLEDTLQRDISIEEFSVFCDTKIVYSQPKDSVFKKLLVESDNFIAEQLLLGSAAFLFDTLSSEKAIRYAFDNYFFNWKEKIAWRDGSGLSRYNMISPEFFVDLLEEIYRENEWRRIKTLLPDNGKEGTLKNFLRSSPSFVYAKSGSMTGVYNLSGYLVTDKGNVLAFSMMNNNFDASFRKVKSEMGKLLLEMKEKW